MLKDDGRYTPAEIIRDLPGKDRVVKCQIRDKNEHRTEAKGATEEQARTDSMTRHAADFRYIRLCLGTHQAELFLFLQRVLPGESGGAARRTAVSFGRRGGKVI